MAVALVSSVVPLSMAQSADPSSFKRVEQATPDHAKGEVSVSLEFFGDDLFKRHTTYKDGSVSTIEYLPDGKPKAELIESKGGTKTVRLFDATGSGLIRETVLKNGLIEVTDFRSDGRTVWYKQFISKAGKTAQYFDKTGRLKLEREFLASGKMKVTVFNGAGAVQYIQVWVPSGRRYMLDHILEPLGGGSSRKIILIRGRPDRCDYLKKDGSLIRSETNGNFSKPVDRMRLREFDPSDDKTCPGIRLPSARMRP
jgi:hypothetical protein